MRLLSFKQNCHLKALLMLCFFILFLSTSGIVSAANGDEDVIGSKLCNIVGMLSGRTTKAICLIAIIVLGITVFTGRVNWSTAMITVIAIVIITQAPAVLKFVSGNDASDCKATTTASP
ncbi:TrbC/VirB2 family protein [Orientia tsutsugamushi]|uniref:TrbC/VirB2 family protein n=1 Tax=Orientia tsutsugamushi TaxID=784 RepID=UPI00030C4B5C|nr:TrbC/VirB2 family protein [Orientia tsutsugamushi]